MLIRKIANDNNEAIILLDSELKVVVFNHVAANLFRIDAQKTYGKSFTSVCKKAKVDDFLLKNEVKKILLKGEDKLLSNFHGKQVCWKIDSWTENDAIFYLIKSEFKTRLNYQNEILKYQTLIESMPCNVYWVDQNSKMIDCNHNVLEMLNLSRHEFRGKTYEELAKRCNWPKGLSNKLKKDDRWVMKTGKPILSKEDPPIPHADGTFSNFLTSRVPLRNRNGKIIGIAGISTEISALKNAQVAAEAASHAKSEFIANMSHDIRTPLTGIIGMSHILEKEVSDPEKKEHAHWVYESGQQLLSLLNSVLEVVSSDSANENDVRHECFDLHDIVHGVLLLERAAVKAKRLDFKMHISGKVPHFVVSDKMKLHRILLNLIGNAIKFTDEGYVSLDVKLKGYKKKQAEVEFHIQDTGIGIPAEVKAKIFERFFKVSPSFKGKYLGSGIGLHIARKFAAQLGGEITVESKENQGTHFVVTLLLDIADKQVEEVAEKKRPPLLIKKKNEVPHILLVEDNPVALMVLKRMVLEQGARVFEALSAEAAIPLIQSEDLDLIITDIGLPGQSGDEMTMEIRAWEAENQHVPLPIFALTGHADEEMIERCLKAGVDEVYQKPMKASMLKVMLSRWKEDLE